ncbi:hypothetical protein IFR05_011431 [Cadophora sp. M221]|nr:hypothetical protein IFR05_011431 [Cadophora sp. M221]
MDDSIYDVTESFNRTILSDSNNPGPAIQTLGLPSTPTPLGLDIADVWQFVLAVPNLNRYRPISFNPTGTLFNIGQGACYRVDRGEFNKEGGGQIVAIKYLKATEHPSREIDHAESSRSIETVLRELRILTHDPVRECPNIVRLLGYGSRDVGQHISLYLVAEFATHGTLRDYLQKERDQKVGVVKKIKFCSDIANGLAALHASGVADGDMKLENTLLCEGENGNLIAKLSDFGHSILDDESRYIGTAIYNAPEVRQGRSNSTLREDHFKCDIFSYGLMVWEIVQDGRRYLETKYQDDPITWLKNLPRDDLFRMALLAVRGLLPADGAKITLLQNILEVTLRDDPSVRALTQDILKLFSLERAQGSTVPFPIQERVFARLQVMITTNTDPEILGRALFELSMCYFYGFGVGADRDMMLSYLRTAASLKIPMAMRICHRMHSASLRQLPPDFAFDHSILQAEHELQHLPVERYFSTRIRRHEKLLQNAILAAPFDLYTANDLIENNLTFQDLEKLSRISSRSDIDVTSLVSKSSLVDAPHLGPLLHFAARLGHLPTVKLLVDCGADVNSFWKGFGTPITAACRGGHSDVVEYLISKGATAERNQADTGPTPLSWMIMFDEEDLEPMIKLLVDNGGNINSFPTEVVEIREHSIRFGMTPICFAVQARYFRLVEVLLDAKVATGSKKFFTPLDLAVSLAFPEITALLLERNVSSSQSSPLLHQGLTNSLQILLHHDSSYREMCKSTIDIVLQSKYSDINAADEHGLTALAQAICYCPYDAGLDQLEVLISRGAKLHVSERLTVQRLAEREDRHGGNILKLLLTTGCLDSSPSLLNDICAYGDKKLLEALIDFGVDVNAPDVSSGSAIGALHSSVLVPGNYEVIRTLLNHGANIDIIFEGVTALEGAIMSPIGDGDVIDLFIERGATLTSVQETTILMTAARLASKINGSHILFHLLRHERVRALINTPSKTEKGVTPLHMACLGHDFEAVNALLQAGVTIDMSRQDNPITFVRISGRLPEPNWNDQGREFDPYRHQLRAERTMLLLLDKVKPGHHQTPLHVACLLGNFQRVAELVDSGADIWAEDSDGKTPIGHINLNAINSEKVADDPLSVKFLANINRIHDYLKFKMKTLEAAASDIGDTECDWGKSEDLPNKDDSPEQLIATYSNRLQRCKAELGENDPQTLREMNDLSNAYQLTEDGYKQSEALELMLFERRKVVLKGDDPDLWESRSSHVRLLLNAGKPEEARKFAEEYLELAVTLFGEDDHNTDVARLNLSYVESAQRELNIDQYKEDLIFQKELYQQMGRREGIGFHNRDVLAIRFTLAQMYYGLGQWEDAHAEVESLVEILEVLKKDKYPEFFSSIVSLGKTCESHASWSDALLIYKTALKHARKTRGDQSYYTIKALEAFSEMQKVAGNFVEAADLQLELVEIFKAKHGIRHLETQKKISGLAGIYFLQDRLLEENVIRQQVVDAMQDMFGSTDERTLEEKNALVSVLHRRRLHEKAAKVAREVVEGYKSTLGDVDPKTVAAETQLAVLINLLDRRDEAIGLQEKSLEALEAINGKVHDKTAKALVNLGAMYLRDGRNSDGEAVLHRAHAIYTELYGAASLDVSNCFAFLATACINKGSREEATAFHEQALEIERKIRGSDQLETLSVMQSLSYDYTALGQFDKAITLQTEVLDGYRALYGDEHKDTLQAGFDLGSSYHSLENYAEAKELYQQSLDGRRKVLGDSHDDTLTSLDNLSVIYAEMNQWEDAQPLVHELFTRRLEKHGSDDPRTITARQGLAAAYHCQGMWTEMETLHLEIVEIFKRTLGDDHADTIDAMEMLAVAHENLGNTEAAIELNFVILDHHRANLGIEDERTLQTMRDLATGYANIEEHEKALPLREEALGIYRKTVGVDGEDCISMETQLAITYYNCNRLDEAEALELEVLETRSSLSGEEDQATLDAMESLARTYVKKKDYTNAESLYLRLVALQQKISTIPLDPDVLKTHKLLEDMYFCAERWVEAKKHAVVLLEAMRCFAPRNNGKGILSALTDMRKICDRLEEKRVVEAMDKQIEMERERRSLNWGGDRQIFSTLERLRDTKWTVELPDPLPFRN